MLEAALFGAIAQSALIMGALLAWKFPALKKPLVVGALMAFGAGAIISAASIDLVAVSYDEAGAGPTAIGVGIGALLYFGIIALLERRSHEETPGEVLTAEVSAPAAGGHGAQLEVHGASKKEARNLTIGMVIDGVPESIAVGLTLHTATAGVSAALVGSIFISAVPEAIGISAALLAGGIAMASILLRFSAVVVIGAVFAAVGYTLLSNASDSTQAIIQSVAAGALLVVVINEMIPIAVRSVKGWAGIIGTAGFVFSAALTRATGG
ncbi:MAG: ZIP family metal transporter [Ilumatobacteraceae bacterium]